MRRFQRTKSTLCLLLIMTIVLAIPLAASAVAPQPARFVALGDSTGFSLSAFPDPTNRDLSTLDGYNDQFARYLGCSKADGSYVNKAWPGDRTHELLADLNDTAGDTIGLVTNAKYLTVTIGGNNLLGPSIAAICGLWGIDPADYTDDLDGRQMLSDLGMAIAARCAADPDYSPLDDFSRLMDPADPAFTSFHTALLAGLADFKKQWPQIAARIRKLNSKAELYVCTVHNPLQVSGTDDPLYPLYLEFEVLLGAINLNIRKYALTYRYRMVDVNTICKLTSGAITFDLVGAAETAAELAAMEPSDPQYPAKALLFFQQTDPHPSYVGHCAVYKLMKVVRATTPYRYWR